MSSHQHKGVVTQIIGPVLDIRFAEGELPELRNAVTIHHAGKVITAEVAQHIGDNVVRCIAMNSTDGLVRGMEANDTGTPISVPVGEECLGRIFNLLGEPIDHGEPVGENPSPGNRAGGITTLEEKSLGCTQKGGSAPVEDVLHYGEPLRTRGLSLLQAPGNDLVASTALAASGAQLILFTTGRGTPFGSPVPTMKLSTNTALAQKKPHWIDFDAGQLLDGIPMTALADSLLARMIAVASGTDTVRSEGLSRENLAIWKDGVTL